jgi:hypothetical protein
MRRRYMNAPVSDTGYVVETPAARPVVAQPVVSQEVGAGQVITQSGTSAWTTERPAWSPAQALAVIAGLVLTIIGAIGLARTGTNLSDVASTHARAAGLSFTAVSALVQLIAGVLLLGSAVFPESAKVGLALFGVILLGWGIVVAADTTRLYAVWGYSESTGVLYVVIGALMLIAAAVSPIFFSQRRRMVTGQGQQINRGYSRL